MMREEAQKRPLSDALLMLAATRLCYELDQVAMGTNRVTNLRYGLDGEEHPSDSHLGNVVLEAFLVHIRVLDDFLGNTKPRGEAIVATDFSPLYPPKYGLHPERRLEVDRRIQHVTLRRAEDMEWRDRQPLTNAVFAQFKVFMDSLADSYPYRAEWLGPRFATARRFVMATGDGWLDLAKDR